MSCTVSLGVVVTGIGFLALHWLAARAQGKDIFPNPVLVFQAMASSTAAVNPAETAESAAAGVAEAASLPADPTSTLRGRLQSLMTPPLTVSEAAPECSIV